jgi:hypothetical protein
MFIVDLNQVMIANLMAQIGNHTNVEIDEAMLRHMILNSLRAYHVKFHREYGEMIIAADAGNYWRRKIFPYYKANRRKAKEASELDWNAIFTVLNKVRDEVREFFPYRVVQVETAEADDVIATLVKRFRDKQKVLILSGDKDFIQLHGDTVAQFDPVHKRKIEHPDPKAYLFEHVLRGDPGDGVPNVLSEDAVFITDGVRQKPLTAKRLGAWHAFGNVGTSKFYDDLKENEVLQRNYNRNSMLIDLSNVPQDVEDRVLAVFESQGGKDRSKLMSYFMNNRLRYLMDSMNDF